jgi:mevalonate kinase
MDAAQHTYETELLPFPALRAPRLVRACRALRERGVLGAKFSGAGGDGSVIALVHDERAAQELVPWLDAQGVAAWYVPVGPPA